MPDDPTVPESARLGKRARLARLLADRAAGTTADGSGPLANSGDIPLQPRDRALPLSFAQQRIWFFEQLNPGTPLFHIHFGVQLTGPLDVERLSAALSATVARHEVLRTSFTSIDGVPGQIASGPSALPIRTVDLRGVAIGDRSRVVQAHAETHARAPFDLRAGSPIRAELLRLAEDAHVLLVTMHHIASDGTSASIVMRELKALYEAPGTALEPLTIQYADFASWQRARAGDRAVADAQLSYWRDRLAGDLPVLTLPTDRPRGDRQTYRGGAYLTTLTPDFSAGLKEFSRARGATFFMTMLAAFQLLLGRLAGQDDVIVGIPVSGRGRPEVEPLIGCFINTLPIRTRLVPASSFDDLLRDVRETALAAYANQDVPFDRLVEEINPPRDPGRSPIFQVLFNLLGADAAWRIGLNDVAAEPLPQLDEPSKFDITLYVGEAEGAIYLRAVYNADLFTMARVQEIVSQYRQLLAEAVAAPDTAIDAYSLRTPEALVVLPDPTRPISSRWDGHVLDRVAEVAAADGARLAIQQGNDRWSYATLDATSRQVAVDLAAFGVRAGDIVAIHATRHPALVAAMLGVWRAGAAFLVLDAAYPEARLASYVERARPKAWIAVDAAISTGFLEAASASGLGAPLQVRRAEEVAGSHVEGERGDVPDPDALAYVAFTSGSTGTPKGILGTAGPISHFLSWQASTYAIQADDRVSLLSGLAHDPLLRDVLAPLWAGASLHIPEARDLETGQALVTWLAASRISVAHLTPAMVRLADQAPASAGPLPLRLAFLGGDLLRSSDVARLRRLAPAVRVVNFYGATETPQAMAAFDVDDAWLSSAATRVPLGRGIDGVQLLVLNAAGSVCGIGELGEICVRTPYLARGYLADPGTTPAFTPNPFTDHADDRLYRTRDAGRYLPDGTVEWVGRLDGQIKVRGYRIEPGDIEAALTAQPGVGDAVVLADIGADEEVGLTAFVTGEETSGDRLRGALAARLPVYMLPRAIVHVDSIPLTPNRKIDRVRLAALATSSPAAAPRPFVPPATATEQTLAAIWGDLLRVGTIGVDDNFFELGGHSLIATQLMARLHHAFGVSLPLRALFDAPTIGGLSRHIDALRWTLTADTSTVGHAVEFEL